MNRRALAVCASLILLAWSLASLAIAVLMRAGSDRPPHTIEDLLIWLTLGGTGTALLLVAAITLRLPRAVSLVVWLAHLATSIAAVLVTRAGVVDVPGGNGISIEPNVIILGTIAECVGLSAVILPNHAPDMAPTPPPQTTKTSSDLAERGQATRPH